MLIFADSVQPYRITLGRFVWLQPPYLQDMQSAHVTKKLRMTLKKYFYLLRRAPPFILTVWREYYPRISPSLGFAAILCPHS